MPWRFKFHTVPPAITNKSNKTEHIPVRSGRRCILSHNEMRSSSPKSSSELPLSEMASSATLSSERSLSSFISFSRCPVQISSVAVTVLETTSRAFSFPEVSCVVLSATIFSSTKSAKALSSSSERFFTGSSYSAFSCTFPEVFTTWADSSLPDSSVNSASTETGNSFTSVVSCSETISSLRHSDTPSSHFISPASS